MAEDLRKIFIATIVTAIVMFFLNLAVDNPYTHRIVRAMINSEVQAKTNIGFDFKALKLSLFSPGVDLYAATISPSNLPAEHIAKASLIRVRISVWALLMGEFKFSLIETYGLEGIWPPPFGFEGFLKESDLKEDLAEDDNALTWPPDMPNIFEKIVIKNSRMFLEHPLQEEFPYKPSWLMATVEGLNVELDFESWEKIAVYVDAAKSNFSIDKQSYVEDLQFKSQINLEGKKLFITKLDLSSDRLSGAFSGVTTLSTVAGNPFGLMNIKVDGSVDGDLSALGSYLDLEDTHGGINGKLSVSAEIPLEGEGEPNFVVDAAVQAQQAVFTGFKLFNTRANLKIDKEKMLFSDVDLIIGDKNYADIDGVLNFDEEISYDFLAKTHQLHMVDLLDVFNVNFDAIDSEINSENLRIVGTGSPFLLNVLADAEFAELHVPALQQAQEQRFDAPRCLLDFQMQVTSSGLDFKDTNGNCYRLPKSKKLLGVKNKLQIHADAELVAPIRIGGKIKFGKGMDLNLALTDVYADVFSSFANYPIQGFGSINTIVAGPFDAIEVKTNIFLDDLTFNQMQLGKMRGELIFKSGSLFWEKLSVSPNPESKIQLTAGALSIDTLHLQTAIGVSKLSEQTFVTFIKPWADIDLAMYVSDLDLLFEGQLQALNTWNLGGKVELLGAKYNGETLFDKIWANVEVNEARVQLKDSSLIFGTLDLNTDLLVEKDTNNLANSDDEFFLSSLGISSKDKFKLQISTNEAKNLRAWKKDNHLSHLPYIDKYLALVRLAGLLELDLELLGSFDDYHGNFDLHLLYPKLFDARVSPFQIKGFIDNTMLDVMLSHGGHAFEGRMSLDWGKPGIPYQWYFSMNRVDLRAFVGEFFANEPRNFAYLSADWTMHGKFSDWWKSEGILKIKDFQGQYVSDLGNQTKDIELHQSSPIEITISPEGWKVQDEKKLFFNSKYLGMRLSLEKSRLPDEIDMKLTSIINMSLLRNLFPEHIDTAAGKLRVVARLAGSLENPKFQLEVTDFKRNPYVAATWRPVQLGITQARPPLENIRVKISYNNSRLNIDQFLAQKGAGTISINGAMDFSAEERSQSQISIQLENATVVYPVAVLKNFEMQMSGDLVLSGNTAPFLLSGDLRVARARTTREVDIRKEILSELRKQSFKTSISTRQPFLEFDMNILADQAIRIHNRSIKGVLSTNIQLRGNNEFPQIGGNVNVERGTVNYHREFKLSRGFVTFDDPVKPDPSLDIVSEAEIGNYQVYIVVSGRASNPVVEYSIDPPTRENGAIITKSEILILIVQGSLPKEEKVSADGAQAALSAGMNLVMSGVETPLEELLELTGQKVIRRVYPDTYPSEEGPIVRLNAPLDLGENFDVVVRVDQAQRMELTVEHSLHENVSLTGSMQRSPEKQVDEDSSFADAAVDLKFRFSFD